MVGYFFRTKLYIANLQMCRHYTKMLPSFKVYQMQRLNFDYDYGTEVGQLIYLLLKKHLL